MPMSRSVITNTGVCSRSARSSAAAVCSKHSVGSSGSNLATVAAAELRGRVRLALQVLLYPVTDSDFDRPSYREHGEGLPLTRADMAWFFGHYAAPRDWRDPRISALRRTDLAGCPPAWIATAEYDVLRDEGRAYADALGAAGVPVTSVEVPSLPHDFVRLFNHLAPADEIVGRVAEAIHAACTVGTPGALNRG